jgi:hypothetical protein
VVPAMAIADSADAAGGGGVEAARSLKRAWQCRPFVPLPVPQARAVVATVTDDEVATPPWCGIAMRPSR